MKIVSIKDAYKEAFDGIVMEPLRFFDFDMSLIDDLTIYLGINPRPWVKRPHYSPDTKEIVILLYDQLSIKDNMRLLFLGAHEIGHHLHFKILGSDYHEWGVWAHQTGRILSFDVYDSQKGTQQVRAYEQFANDIMQTINYRLKPYYLNLFGIRLVEMEIGNLEYQVNGQLRETDIAPYIYQNRAMAPMRAVAEALDINTHYLLQEGKQLVKFAKRIPIPVGHK